MMLSRCPQITRNGTSSARYSRSLAFTRWPLGSTIVRSVCTKAARASRSASDAWPRAISEMSVCRRQPDATEEPPTPRPAAEHPLARQHRQHELGSRQRGHAEQQVDLLAEPAAVDQDQPIAALGELIGELHRDTAAERVPDERRPVVTEGDQQIAHAARVGAERVVASGLGRAAMPQQVGRDHREALGERRHHALPRLAVGGDAVHEHDHRAAAGGPVGHAVAVKLDLLRFQAGIGSRHIRGG